MKRRRSSLQYIHRPKMKRQVEVFIACYLAGMRADFLNSAVNGSGMDSQNSF